MATFTSATAFASHVAGYGDKIERVSPAATRAAADVAGVAIRNAGSRFHIKGRTGKKWNLGAKVTGPYGYAGNVLAYVDADPAGFWHLIEKGAAPHRIGPRRRRGGGRKAVVVPGRGIFAHVNHPGTGSIGHPWERGVALAGQMAPKAFEREIVSVFAKAA